LLKIKMSAKNLPECPILG